MCEHMCINRRCAACSELCIVHVRVLCGVRPLFAMWFRLFIVSMSQPNVREYEVQDTFPSHLPSVTVDCRQLQPIFMIKNSKFFFCTLRLFPQIDIQPPKYRFPCAFSGHAIFEVSAQNQTPTSLNANAKKTRMKRFVPMLLASF